MQRRRVMDSLHDFMISRIHLSPYWQAGTKVDTGSSSTTGRTDFPRYYHFLSDLGFTVMSRICYGRRRPHWQFNYQTRNYARTSCGVRTLSSSSFPRSMTFGLLLVMSGLVVHYCTQGSLMLYVYLLHNRPNPFRLDYSRRKP